ncbi:MAG: alpha/beta hydrolase [Actinomycetota bacterium]|nr:alpha/beta hydrolase [Actinomycetota bacterium]
MSGDGYAGEEVDQLGEAVLGAVAGAVPDEVARSSFDPTRAPAPDEKPWWGRPVGELRWQAELARLLVDPVYRGVGLPRGDGGPVLLIPGFLAGDSSLYLMAGWLRRLGHDPHRAGITVNVDCSDRAVDRLEKVLQRLHGRSGRRVAVVGHSRGGHFAKALSSRRPHLVRTTVTMGSGLDQPFDISLPTKVAVASVRATLRRLDPETAARGCLTDTCDCPYTRDYSAPFPTTVPLTSIYTDSDGIVRPRSCVVPYARNVRVPGTHLGLTVNRHAYRVLAAVLAA